MLAADALRSLAGRTFSLGKIHAKAFGGRKSFRRSASRLGTRSATLIFNAFIDRFFSSEEPRPNNSPRAMMTFKNRSFLPSVLVFAGLIGSAAAAATFFDDFSSGGYPSSAAPNLVSISTPFADTRYSYGNGDGWSSKVDTSAGNLTYTLSARSDPGPNVWFAMIYTSTLGDMSLAGYDAFVIHVVALTGSGQLLAHFGTGSPGSSVVPVNFTGTGDLLIPFGNLGVGDPSHPSAISFEILPGVRDFSVTISGISVIPEPSSALLAGLCSFVFVAWRRR